MFAALQNLKILLMKFGFENFHTLNFVSVLRSFRLVLRLWFVLGLVLYLLTLWLVSGFYSIANFLRNLVFVRKCQNWLFSLFRYPKFIRFVYGNGYCLKENLLNEIFILWNLLKKQGILLKVLYEKV